MRTLKTTQFLYQICPELAYLGSQHTAEYVLNQIEGITIMIRQYKSGIKLLRFPACTSNVLVYLDHPNGVCRVPAAVVMFVIVKIS